MPQVHDIEAGPGLHIHLWELRENEEQLREGLVLSALDEAMLAQVTRTQRRCEILAVRQMIRAAYPQHTPQLTYEVGGCPLLSNGHQVSISHSRQWVVVVLSTRLRVGVDIEYRSARIARIQQKFVHPAEGVHLPKGDENNHLLGLWGAKEAIVKYTRNRGIDFKNAIRVAPFRLSSSTTKSWVSYRINEDWQEVPLCFFMQQEYVISLVHEPIGAK